jgi:hypothetical protein
MVKSKKINLMILDDNCPTCKIPPNPPLKKGGISASPFSKGGLRGIFIIRLFWALTGPWTDKKFVWFGASRPKNRGGSQTAPRFDNNRLQGH